MAGTNVTTACLNGPKGGVASRYCLKSGKWSKVDDLQCNELSGTTQRLATLREVKTNLIRVFDNGDIIMRIKG